MTDPKQELINYLRWLADKLESNDIRLMRNEITRSPWQETMMRDVVSWKEDINLEFEIYTSEYK